MADTANQIMKLTECCICLKEFTDPRMLPCIHTFCFECLKQTSYQTTRGRNDQCVRKSCPLCRKVFTIPAAGIDGLPKNFFMEHLMEITKHMQLSNRPSIPCDICRDLYEDDEKRKPATMRCLGCRYNFCEHCGKAHTLHNSSISHHVVKIGSETEEDMRRISPERNCNFHNQKPLDYYCPKCEKIFCVSCVLENHVSHGCKDVSTVEDEFRKVIERNALKISSLADEVLSKSVSIEMKTENILLNLAKAEGEIWQRNLELKEMIDNHTSILLEELSLMKLKHVKDCENEKEEIDCIHTILKSFETYCTELISKGSAGDVCSCVSELITRSNELEKDHEAFTRRPYRTIEFSFTAGNISEENVIGRIQESFAQIQNCLVITGLSDGGTLSKDVLTLNLNRRQLNSTRHQQLPTIMQKGETTSVYSNTMYITGLGNNSDEIWKYNWSSVWRKCAGLARGRIRHCAEFIGEMLYICGGRANSDGSVLDSVEAFSAVADTCATVGKLVHRVQDSGNCVPFRSSLYIFGGAKEYGYVLDCVQLYDTRYNTCTILSKPMPSSQAFMQAVRIPWQRSVILLGCNTCFIFNFETETWQERREFKTDVYCYGLALQNDRIFVIGGGIYIPNDSLKRSLKCRDDVRYVPLQNVIDDKPVEWKSYAKLGRESLVWVYGTVMHDTTGKALPITTTSAR